MLSAVHATNRSGVFFAKRLSQAVDRRERARLDKENIPLNGSEFAERETMAPAGSIFGKANAWLSREAALHENIPIVCTPGQAMSNPIAKRLCAPLSGGDQIVREMTNDIDGFVPTPTDFQRSMISANIELQGPGIYIDEWAENSIDIQRRNGWRRNYKGIAGVLTGRKEGKSTACAMVVVNTLFNRPGVEIALFSRVLKQACLILDMAKILAVNHARAAEFTIEASAYRIRVTHKATGNVRIVTAWSGDANVSHPIVFFFCFLFIDYTGESQLDGAAPSII